MKTQILDFSVNVFNNIHTSKIRALLKNIAWILEYCTIKYYTKTEHGNFNGKQMK